MSQQTDELENVVCLAATAFSMLEGYFGPQWFEVVHALQLDGPDKVTTAAAAIAARRSAVTATRRRCGMSAGTMTCEECGTKFPTHPANVVEALKVQLSDVPDDPNARAKTRACMMQSLPITEGQADGLLATGELRLYVVLCSPCRDLRLDEEDDEDDDKEGGEP